MSKLSLGVEREAKRLAVVPLDDANRMLAAVATPAEARHLESIAAAARRYADSLEARNYAAEIQLRAGRRGGQLLIEMAGNGTRAKNRNRLGSESPPVTLADLGIEPMRSSRWQTLARYSEEAFERHIAETKASAEPLSGSRLAPLMTSDTPEWYTPPHIVAAVVAVMGGIDLDPCADPAKGIPAANHFTAEDDGLSQPWRGRVYMNPPYGGEIGAWVDRLAEEFEHGNISEAIALVPARTDTSWWAHLPAAMVCFITGRLTFSAAPSPAPFPSAVCYLGSNQRRFAEEFLSLGLVYVRLESAAAA